MPRIATHDPRKVRRLWIQLGGEVRHVRGTGEERWFHPDFDSTVRCNSRRHDIPARVLCRLNHLVRRG